MTGLFKLFIESGAVDFAIIGVGIFGLGVIVDRFKAFFVDYSLKVDVFMKQVRALLEADKVEEAITFCAANQSKPMAFVIKSILEKSDRDDASMESAVDIAVSEVGPLLTRRMPYLPMIANVSTLIGLLGTVAGLIMSFKAVSFADQSQKQALLADGISMAMHATAMGLMVAIPVMIAYSFLHAKQAKLFTDLEEHAYKTIDYMKSRTFHKVHEHGVYPQNVGIDTMPKKDTMAAPPAPPSAPRKAV